MEYRSNCKTKLQNNRKQRGENISDLAFDNEFLKYNTKTMTHERKIR